MRAYNHLNARFEKKPFKRVDTTVVSVQKIYEANASKWVA